VPVLDGHIPRHRPPCRRAVPDTRLAEINETAAVTGDDPEPDTLFLRLHTETACRGGGALGSRPDDLDPDQCPIRLREKGETVRWQPVSPYANGPPRRARPQAAWHAPPDGQLLRYATVTDNRAATKNRKLVVFVQRRG
jgi:integrase/recombinase XerC